MNTLEWVALITGICFVIGIAAGSLLVMSIPTLMGLPEALRQPSRRARDEPPQTSETTAAPGATGRGEADEEEDLPDGTWWRDVG